MLVSPSKIKQNKLLSGRTINFETVKKTHGNMVVIPTTDKKLMAQTIDSKLFRPTQLWALYTPRRIKPAGRQAVIVDQKTYYSEMRADTNNRIRKGKTLIGSYGGQNLVYDICGEFSVNRDVLERIRGEGPQLQKSMIPFFGSKLESVISDPDYENVYLVFPMNKPFANPMRIINGTDYKTTDPLALFIKLMDSPKFDRKALAKVKMVFFYVPSANIVLAIDIHRPDFDKEWLTCKQKIRRLSNYLNHEDDLADELEDESVGIAELDKEDKIENKKEEIKNVVLSKVAKTIHANNLTDFEAASQDEKDIMVTIDKKVDDYLAKKENMSKTVNDMVDDLEKDADVKAKAVRYVETKKASAVRSETLAKGLEKEAELIGSLQDLDDDSTSNEGDKFNVDEKDMDSRIEISRLSSIDDEYNKKQRMTDITNVVSSFSNSQITPLSVDNLTFDAASTHQDEKDTMNVRFKTSDGKPLSFQLDVPKIVDKRYLYLGGNKKVIKKQLVRLPIVKTKADRVELTSNFAKMTIERTAGKLSRKNEYILKKLKEMANNKAFTIEYGDNRVVNSKLGYSNDFEYEELAGSINKIISGKYHLIFNRDDMRDELDLLNMTATQEEFLGKTRTPLGFEKVGDNFTKLIFIENNAIFSYDFSTKKIERITTNFFDFLSNIVLKLDMSTLPSIGRSFIYTKVKFLATTYPMLAVVASQNGLTDIMKRYKINYRFSHKQERKSIGWVEVKFKDIYMYYEDTIRNTLLLNALYLMDTTEFPYSDFDRDIPYTRYFMKLLGDSIGIHTRNTLRINLDVFIDPITRDVLRDLKQPTDIIDVLLYANTLLVGNQYKPLNNLTNYRVRSNEIVADVMYQIIADAYVNYEKHKINGRPTNMSIPKNALIAKLLMQENINDKSTLNPTLEAEQIAQMSAKGHRGVNLNRKIFYIVMNNIL